MRVVGDRTVVHVVLADHGRRLVGVDVPGLCVHVTPFDDHVVEAAHEVLEVGQVRGVEGRAHRVDARLHEPSDEMRRVVVADEHRVQVGHEVGPGLLEEPPVVGVDHNVVERVVMHVAERRHDQPGRGQRGPRGRRRDRVVLQRVVRGDRHAELGGHGLDLLLHEVGLAAAHDLERHGVAGPVTRVEVLGAVEGRRRAMGEVDPVQPALVGEGKAAPIEDEVGRDGGQELPCLGRCRCSAHRGVRCPRARAPGPR